MSRISKDDYYLNIALAVSRRSTCLKRRYGAVIVKDDEIIATGYNGSPRGETNCCDLGFCKRMNVPHNSGNYADCHSVHAEQNAMISAKRSNMLGATLYLAGEDENGRIEKAEPCPICDRMIKNAGIARVVGSFSKEEESHVETNGDRISKGTNENLAHMIQCPYCIEDICNKKKDCLSCKKEWLDAPEENE